MSIKKLTLKRVKKPVVIGKEGPPANRAVLGGKAKTGKSRKIPK